MISQNTEELINTEIVQQMIAKFNLNVKFTVWDSVKIPFLFNDYVVICIYLELGALEISIFDKINWKWNRIPVDSYNMDIALRKTFFDKICNNLRKEQYFNLEVTQYLHYYINFIIDFLPQIFEGDFRKIENHMEPVTEAQKEEILRVIME